MLTEERKNQILRLVDTKGSASLQELINALGASESTIRRDLTALDREGYLTKVHGGAISLSDSIATADAPVSERQDLNLEKKIRIAKYAASLIADEDIVFLDAGTTTGLMIEYITSTKTTFITNAVSHARHLAAAGFLVYMPSGILKASTEALIGSDTCAFLQNMYFTKGFFGINGIAKKQGCTTPDRQEAAVKALAFSHTRDRFIVADSSKFNQISAAYVAGITEGEIITDENVPDEYRNLTNLRIVRSESE